MAVPSSGPTASATIATSPTPSTQNQGRARRVLLYPQEGPTRRQLTVEFQPPGELTLRARELDCFDVSPTRCDDCYLPCCQHPSLPGVAFSILMSCPHTADLADAEDLQHNKALNTLLGDRGIPCLGHVVLVKHPFPPAMDASNMDLPILDIDPSEFAMVDEVVLQWMVKLSSLPGGDAYFYPPGLVEGGGW